MSFLNLVSHPLPEYMESGNSIEIMAEQVRQVFPHVSQHAIIQDLLETGSPEMTIENILSGAVDVTAQPVLVEQTFLLAFDFFDFFDTSFLVRFLGKEHLTHANTVNVELQRHVRPIFTIFRPSSKVKKFSRGSF